MFGFIVATIIFASWLVGVWALAQHEILWGRALAGTFGLVVTGESDSDDLGQSGGVVDVIHEASGKLLDKSDHNAFKWCFVDGKENRDLLHLILGVQWIGPARSLRKNSMKGSGVAPKFLYYSREQEVEITGVKTIGVYSLNFKITFQRHIIYPVRAVLSVDNYNVVLSQMITEAVSNIVGAHEPEYFVQGNSDHKKEIVQAIKDIDSEILENIGISLYNIKIQPITMDERSQELFELIETTRRRNIADISIAEKDKQLAILAAQGAREAGILSNDASADYVERVLTPIGNIPDGAMISLAKALENTKATTVVLGAPALPVVGTQTQK